ncbi:MAG: hypothetical protein WA609_08010 [Terriglobales bacterium]
MSANSDSNSEDHRAGPRYAAAKPTVDEILASIARHHKTSTDFLKADIEMALTFAGIARSARISEERERNRRSARKAYDTVIRLIARVDLTDHDAKVLGRSLARLKSELRGLGEVL